MQTLDCVVNCLVHFLSARINQIVKVIQHDNVNPSFFRDEKLICQRVNRSANGSRIDKHFVACAPLIKLFIFMLCEVLKFHGTSKRDGSYLAQDYLWTHLPGINPHRYALHSAIHAEVRCKGGLASSRIGSDDSDLARTQSLKITIQRAPTCRMAFSDLFAIARRKLCYRLQASVKQ